MAFYLGIFSFATNKDLRNFANVRSMIKACRWLGYSVYECAELINKSNLLDEKLHIYPDRDKNKYPKTSINLKPLVIFLQLNWSTTYLEKDQIVKHAGLSNE